MGCTKISLGGKNVGSTGEKKLENEDKQNVIVEQSFSSLFGSEEIAS